jgi:hypothetical protein
MVKRILRYAAAGFGPLRKNRQHKFAHAFALELLNRLFAGFGLSERRS